VKVVCLNIRRVERACVKRREGWSKWFEMQNNDMFDLLLIIIKISGGGIRVARRRQDEQRFSIIVL